MPLVLALLWVAKPDSVSLMAGALLSLLGEALRFWAVGCAGEPTRKQELDAPRLVIGGPYAMVRNPLYLGTILNGMGVAVAAAGGYAPLQAAALLLYAGCGLAGIYGSIIPLEEKFLLEQFGEEYRRYRERVPALVPTQWKWQAGSGSFELSRALRFERTSLLWLVLIWATLVVLLQSR